MARLDFYLVTTDLLSNIVNNDIAHGYCTDHSIIYLTIDAKIGHRGKGFWKFNNLLLYDPTYIRVVKDEIDVIRTQYHIDSNEIDPQLFLEMLKLNIRGRQPSFPEMCISVEIFYVKLCFVILSSEKKLKLSPCTSLTLYHCEGNNAWVLVCFSYKL